MPQIFGQTHHVSFILDLGTSSPQLFVSSPSVTKRHIKTFKMHLVRYLIYLCYYFTHNTVFLSVLVFKSHDFSYQYQEQPTPTPNIGFSKVCFLTSSKCSSFTSWHKLSLQCIFRLWTVLWWWWHRTENCCTYRKMRLNT